MEGAVDPVSTRGRGQVSDCRRRLNVAMHATYYVKWANMCDVPLYARVMIREVI